MTYAEPNYFKVNRDLLHSDRWLNEPFTRGQAWVDLFGLAQHKKGFFRVRGIRVDVDRGQLAYSKLTLAKRWKWSRNKVRRYLEELVKNGDIIVHQINDLTTVITILKYDFWQGNQNEVNHQTIHQKDTRRTPDEPHTSNDKNDNNDKEYIGSKEPTSKLTDKKSYPKEWYDTCIKEYCKIKNCSFKGNEYLPIQQDLRVIFCNGREPKDVIKAMNRISKSKITWTMNTIKLRMPELLAERK